MRQAVILFLMSIFFVSGAKASPALEPLTVDQAFPIHVYANQNDTLNVEWDIAPGYYLYREKIHFLTAKDSQVKIDTIAMPLGKAKQDNFRGRYQVYNGKVKILVPLLNPEKGLLKLTITYQGCSAAGFCYAAQTKHLEVRLTQLKGIKDLSSYFVSPNNKTISQQDYVTQLLSGHHSPFIIPIFLALGLLLAFTPCVLPMVPILSGIIVGHSRKHETTTSKAFLLSLSYVLGMALTYMILGVVVALLGSSIQAVMQKPWVIVLFSGFFVMLALSLFGFYTLQFPPSWQKHLVKWDRQFKHGTYFGVFLMGSFSSLIVSPCVSAPLVGVLAYIGQTGNVILGATALLSLGLGMGIPLLLVGTSAGKLLPRSGPWMVSIQKIVGILMLGMAVWLVSRLIPDYLAATLWAMLLILAAVMLGAFQTAISKWDKILKIIGVLLFVYAIILANGIEFKSESRLSFKVVKSMSQVDEILKKAKQENKPIMLDFYADWCASCKRMDKEVFENPKVQQALKNLVILRADVTNENEFDQTLSRQFRVIAPPTILFFDRSGKELTPERVIGEFSATQFIQRLQEMKLISE